MARKGGVPCRKGVQEQSWLCLHPLCDHGGQQRKRMEKRWQRHASLRTEQSFGDVASAPFVSSESPGIQLLFLPFTDWQAMKTIRVHWDRSESCAGVREFCASPARTVSSSLQTKVVIRCITYLVVAQNQVDNTCAIGFNQGLSTFECVLCLSGAHTHSPRNHRNVLARSIHDSQTGWLHETPP